MTLTEFLLARIGDDEAAARIDTMGDLIPADCWGPERVLAECDAKRRIVELHANWPVLVKRRPQFKEPPGADPSTITLRLTQQIAWLTEQEYIKRFGDEPPAAPMLRALAMLYADHPDYQEEWRP